MSLEAKVAQVGPTVFTDAEHLGEAASYFVLIVGPRAACKRRWRQIRYPCLVNVLLGIL